MVGRQLHSLLLAIESQRNVTARIAVTALVFLFLLPVQLVGQNAIAQSSCELEPGASDCGGNAADPGSVVQSSIQEGKGGTVSPHAGNPIDLLTGNKYQRGDDFAAFASPLVYIRHYNTALVDQDIGLGFGWRDTYSLRLYAIDGGGYRLVQSDGRTLLFNKPAEDGVSWRSVSSTEGLLRLADDKTNTLQWHLPDEKVWSFVGSYPVALQHPDGTGLSLVYKNERLHSVTDDLGTMLQYHYTEGRRDLMRYSPEHDGTQPGHLACLQLPDGSGIRYSYDAQSNLAGVTHSDGVDWHYEYSDERFPSHLTRAGRDAMNIGTAWGCDDEWNGAAIKDKDANTDKVASTGNKNAPTQDAINYESHWEYHEDGRASTWRQGDRSMLFEFDVIEIDVNKIDVNEFDDVNIDDGFSSIHGSSTVVRDSSQPRTYRYDFFPNAGTGTGTGTSTSTSTSTSTGGGIGRAIANDAAEHRNAAIYVKDCEECNWERLILTKSRLNSNSATVINSGDEQSKPSSRFIERRKLKENLESMSVSVTDTRFGAAAFGGLENVKSNWAGNTHGADDNELDLMLNTLEATNPITVRYTPVYPNNSVPAVTPQPAPQQFCPLPAGMTCSQIEEAMVYAQASECAYGDDPCPNGWVEVNPADLGLKAELFSDGAYNSIILFNAAKNEYMVAFEGTDPLSLGDLNANMENYYNVGNPRQYALAAKAGEELSEVLTAMNPSPTVTFTGHSLGGGLATTAALASGNEAVVFNPAAVGTNVLFENGIDIVGSDNLVDVIIVENDFVTNFQEQGDPHPNDSTFEVNSRWPALGTHYTIGEYSDYVSINAHLIGTVRNELEFIHQSNCRP